MGQSYPARRGGVKHAEAAPDPRREMLAGLCGRRAALQRSEPGTPPVVHPAYRNMSLSGGMSRSLPVPGAGV